MSFFSASLVFCVFIAAIWAAESPLPCVAASTALLTSSFTCLIFASLYWSVGLTPIFKFPFIFLEPCTTLPATENDNLPSTLKALPNVICSYLLEPVNEEPLS